MAKASNRKSEIIYKTVLQAIAEISVEDTDICYLDQTPSNGLDQFSKNEIALALKRLSKIDRVIVFSPPNDPDRKNMAQAMRALVAKLPKKENSKSETRDHVSREPFRVHDFSFIKKRGFDRWYKVRLLEKIGDFKSLSQLNKDKILITILDIQEKFEIGGSEFVRLPISFQRNTPLIKEGTQTNSYRIEALDFLKKRGIVKSYADSGAAGEEYLGIDLDAHKFQKIREEAKKIVPLPKPNRNEKKNSVHIPEIYSVPTEKIGKEETLYEITISEAREILINGKKLSKPRFSGDNERVFAYLFRKPGEIISRSEISNYLGVESFVKPFVKIIESLGFVGDRKKAFFEYSVEYIKFINPITASDLKKHQIKILELPKR